MHRSSAFRLSAVVSLTIAVAACSAAEKAPTFEVKQAPPELAGPMAVKTNLPHGVCNVKIGGKSVIGQVDEDHVLWLWWHGKGDPGAPGKVEVDAPGEKTTSLDVKIDGKLFTTFNFKKDEPRPYLYPVIGPTGEPVTRDWPMKDNPQEKSAKRQDHPHHRSIWTAHGDVRTGDTSKKGTDYWAMDDVKEQGGKRVVQHRDKAGYQKLTRIVRTVSGPVFGLIEAEVDWTTQDGKRELSDTRTYRIFRGDADNRIIDYQLVLHFPDGDVTFADTKEGGLLSARLTPTMDEVGAGGQHGQMVNSKGQTGEKACWGKPAEWCDYVGPVKGKTVGVAIFDGPDNFRHPTGWHIRGYGLYTANPFGTREFTGDKSKDGSQTWKKGENAAFNYRIVIHNGDTGEARIADQYAIFAQAATVMKTAETK